MGVGPVVMLSSDYFCRWPLWARGSLDDATAEGLELSDDLTGRLLDLQVLFEDGFHAEHGWQRAGDEESYARLAVDCWFRLQRELDARGVVVEIDLWPVTDHELRRWLHRAGVQPS